MIILLLILFLNPVIAHSEDKSKIDIKSASFYYTIIASIISFLAIIISIFYKHKKEKVKIVLFVTIALPIIIATLYLIGATIYLNIVSETKGPVHYHADFEIWNCNDQINLKVPTGFTNRIGTPIFHEHNDNRIHVEGVIVKKGGIDLSSFFEVVGGFLSNDLLIMPTNSGIIEMKNNETCNGKKAELQVFIYKITNPSTIKKSGFLYKQEKLGDFQDYIISPYQNIPPGDCIIIEFGIPKNTTDKICESFKLAIQKGDLKEQTN